MIRHNQTALLKVDALRLQFGDVEVLSGVDLSLHAGEFMGLVGPNGSGKTSLIQAIVGLLPASHGQVRIDGIDIATQPQQARQRLGFAPDPSRLPPTLTGRQALDVVRAARGLAHLPPQTLDLAERLGAMPWLDQRLDCCSLGTRQKIAILIALLGDPPLLVLDEVMNGLDPVSSHELKSELLTRCERGHAVLLATHGLEIAQSLVSHAVLLKDGRIDHRWGPNELQHWRHSDPGAFERAVVAALRPA